MSDDMDVECFQRAHGRPAGPPRVRVVTTIEPAKLRKLRAYAYRVNRSIGELADAYVARVLLSPEHCKRIDEADGSA